MLQRMTTYQFKSMLNSGDVSPLPRMTAELRETVRDHVTRIVADDQLKQVYRDQAQLFVDALHDLDASQADV